MTTNNRVTYEKNMTNEPEISKDRRLNDVVLELYGKTVLDENSGRIIPVLPECEFLFSAPYYQNGEKEFLARVQGFGGRVIFDPAFSDEDGIMTKERAESYTRRFLAHRLSRDVRVDIIKVKTAIYEKPEPSIDKGLPLNAFEVRGVIYQS